MSVFKNYKQVSDIDKQMKENSAAWFDATPEEQDRLHEENERLSGIRDELTGGLTTYDPNTGKRSTKYFNNYEYKPYESVNQKKIDSLMKKIEGSRFSYDPENDPSYQAYADMYRREGDRATKSTLAEVATAQGGMSSYTGTAAQMAANHYAQQLTDKIPALEQLAYEKYQAELNNDYNMLDYLTSQDNTAYGRHMDKQNTLYQLAEDRKNDFQYYDEQEYERGIYAQEYEDNQKAEARARVIEDISEGMTPSQEEMTIAGISQEQVSERIKKVAFEDMINRLTTGATVEQTLVDKAGVTPEVFKMMQDLYSPYRALEQNYDETAHNALEEVIYRLSTGATVEQTLLDKARITPESFKEMQKRLSPYSSFNQGRGGGSGKKRKSGKDEDEIINEPIQTGNMTVEEKNKRVMEIVESVEKGNMTEDEAAIRLASVELFGMK